MCFGVLRQSPNLPLNKTLNKSTFFCAKYTGFILKEKCSRFRYVRELHALNKARLLFRVRPVILGVFGTKRAPCLLWLIKEYRFYTNY